MRVKFLLVAQTLVAGLTLTGCARQATTAPSTGPLQFSGTISAVSGSRIAGPIAGARLQVVDGVNLDAGVTTDQSGHYSFAELQSGRFTVSITAPGYVGVAPVVELYRDMEVNFALTPQ